MTRRGGQNCDAGFTLIELVVCLGLLALLTLLIGEGFAIARRAAAVIDRTERQAEIQAVRMHLRRTLERVEPHFERDQTGAAVLAFAGSPDQMRFVVRSDERLEAGGLVMVDLVLEADDTQKVLVERRRPLRPPSVSSGTSALPHPLLRRLETVRFRYFGRSSTGSEPVWSETWSDPSVLPVAVHMEVDFDDGARDPWPPLDVALSAALGVTR